jgi:hypothetical protein
MILVVQTPIVNLGMTLLFVPVQLVMLAIHSISDVDVKLNLVQLDPVEPMLNVLPTDAPQFASVHVDTLEILIQIAD